jgi:hypothetical protein
LCDVDFGHGFWTPIAALAAGERRLSQKRSFLHQAVPLENLARPDTVLLR